MQKSVVEMTSIPSKDLFRNGRQLWNRVRPTFLAKCLHCRLTNSEKASDPSQYFKHWPNITLSSLPVIAMPPNPNWLPSLCECLLINIANPLGFQIHTLWQKMLTAVLILSRNMVMIIGTSGFIFLFWVEPFECSMDQSLIRHLSRQLGKMSS